MCSCCMNPSEEDCVCQTPVDLYFEGIQSASCCNCRTNVYLSIHFPDTPRVVPSNMLCFHESCTQAPLCITKGLRWYPAAFINTTAVDVSPFSDKQSWLGLTLTGRTICFSLGVSIHLHSSMFQMLIGTFMPFSSRTDSYTSNQPFSTSLLAHFAW